MIIVQIVLSGSSEIIEFNKELKSEFAIFRVFGVFIASKRGFS